MDQHLTDNVTRQVQTIDELLYQYRQQKQGKTWLKLDAYRRKLNCFSVKIGKDK